MPKRIRPITLANLATHTSGLSRELGTAPRGTPHFTFPDFRARWRWLPNQRLRSTPGTAALYSNAAFDLLGDALQAAAHKPYAALLAERTLNLLHMHNTTFFPTAAQCSWFYPRVLQHAQKSITYPLELMTINRLPSERYTEKDISPRFWSNGKLPQRDDWKNGS